MNPETYMKEMLKTEATDAEPIKSRMCDGELYRLLHGAMGVSTEAGELLDAVKKHIFYGRDLDNVNLAEELGDLLWYIHEIMDCLHVELSWVMERNIEKLKMRYKNQEFTEENANNRDLDIERKILEGEEV